MTNDKVQVYSTTQLIEAEILKNYLEVKGISVFILNKMDSSYHFGDIELLVSPDEVLKAKKLIEDFSRNE